MSTIFISYSRQSETIVATLGSDLETLGHSVWFDQELSGGQAWWDQILEQVSNLDVFVFALAPKALDSAACKREYQYAPDLGKPILPVLVAEGVSTNLLPPALSAIQFVDYRERGPDATLRLARAINEVPPPKPLPDPLPAAPEVPISYLGGLSEQVETRSTLSLEEQRALVFDLKRSLRESENADDALTLLGKLRKRRDVLADIRDEIDEIVASRTQTPSPSSTTPQPTEQPTPDVPKPCADVRPRPIVLPPLTDEVASPPKNIARRITILNTLFYVGVGWSALLLFSLPVDHDGSGFSWTAFQKNVTDGEFWLAIFFLAFLPTAIIAFIRWAEEPEEEEEEGGKHQE